MASQRVWNFGAGLLTAQSSLLDASDWPQFLGPNRSGVSTDTGLANSWPKNGPPLVWEKKIGEGYSGPVVASDRIIVFYRAGDKDVLRCLDTAEGGERWRFEYATNYQDDLGKGDGPRSTPLIAGKHVYALAADGRLHCLTLDKGEKVWDRSLNTEYQVRKGFFGAATSPIVEGNKLLVNVGGKDAGIVAFDKDTGQELWKATDHEASYSSPVAATIDGVRHVLFFTREGIVSINPDDGAVRFSKRWRARINASVNAATPLIVKDEAFFSASYDTGAILIRVRKDSFEELWKNDESMSNHYNTCVYGDGHLYGIDGRQEGGARLRCVEWKTGKVKWTTEDFGCASIILADGKLIMLTEAGDLVLAEATPAAYREKARVSLLSRFSRAPIALANGKLYARDDKRVICLNLKK